jgi:hypothetical protein
MTQQRHLITQVVLLAIQILVPAFAPLTADQKIAVAGFVSGVQVVIGVRQQSFNTDGTKQN